MKKAVSIGLTILGACVLLLDVVFCVYGLIELKMELDRLTATPGTSGIDYFGLGWALGIGLLLLSGAGLLIAAINAKITANRLVKKACFAAIVAFVLLFAIGICVFFV